MYVETGRLLCAKRIPTFVMAAPMPSIAPRLGLLAIVPYSAAAFVYPYFSLSFLMRSAAAFGMLVPGPKIASAPAA